MDSVLEPNPPLQRLLAKARARLADLFDQSGELVAAAPGRVNLIGEHIDYCDGFVLPLAIERYVVIAASPNGGSVARVGTENKEPVSIDISVDQERSEKGWSNYLRGVIQGFRERDITIEGFDAFIVSSVPLGAGLSSSAALECAFATLLEGHTGTVLSGQAKALLAQKAEHEYAGVPCGIMDQFASVFGAKDQLVFIDCRSAEAELVPFHDPNLSVLVADTRVSHDLSDGGYAALRVATEDALAATGKASWRDVAAGDLRAAQAELDDRTFRAGLHVIGEIERTRQSVQAFRSGDLDQIGSLMAGSHASLRDDFRVSCPELDLLVDTAASLGKQGGVLGARMTGGGFGGSTVTLCRSASLPEIATELHRRYIEQTGMAPAIFATRPARGAHLLS